MQIIRDGLWLCSDCTFVACNGESSGEFNCYRNIEATRKGLANLGPHLVPNFDSETNAKIREFTNRICDSCQTPLAGYRASFAVLGEVDINQ